MSSGIALRACRAALEHSRRALRRTVDIGLEKKHSIAPKSHMNPAPLISVIMNCYNGEKYLKQAIDSVLSQTHQNWEIIFWDNQSTDRSVEIFKSYVDPRLKYFYAPKHSRLYEARNYAIEKCCGEFLAFLDVDDWWFPNKLERQVTRFSDPLVGIVCSNYWIDNERRRKRWLALRRSVPTGWVLDDLLKLYYVGLVTLVVRRSAMDSLDYLCDPRYHIVGDADLVIRLSIRWKLDYVGEPLALYRLHDNNETSKHGLLTEDLKCWLANMGEVEPIRSSPNFSSTKNHFTYVEAMYRILQSDRPKALRLARSLPWGMPKLKLGAALLLPTSMARKFKN
jgi:glycosyltransferase involved in cell wall biosynthesis